MCSQKYSCSPCALYTKCPQDFDFACKGKSLQPLRTDVHFATVHLMGAPVPPLVHVPVLHRTVLELLSPKPGETVLDATVGLGGHAASLLEAVGKAGTLIALDADARHLALAQERLRHFPGRLQCIEANFRDIARLELPPCDVILADLGLCSAHLDDPGRGFSFRSDAPLDLRYGAGSSVSAAAFIADADQSTMTRALSFYGELPQPPLLARQLLADKPATTAALCMSVEKAYGWRAQKLLPQVFQALRIAVNDELGALEEFLEAVGTQLAIGGRLAVISYHSLEDRIVKHAFRSWSTPARDQITGAPIAEAPFQLLTKKPVLPDSDEITRNPRSRSAVLRVITRLH